MLHIPHIGIEDPFLMIFGVVVNFFVYLGYFAVIFPAHVFLTIALFIVVPLIFTRLDWIGFERHRFLWPLRFTPLAAFPAFIALILHAGQWREPPVYFAVPWLVFTAYAGVIGLLSLRFARMPHQVAAALSLIMLAGGGVSFMIACAGWPPLPFPSLIILLSATHFHYAGFATLALIAMQEQYIASHGRQPWIVIGLTIGGFAFILAGISAYRMLELVGAGCMAAGLLLHAMRTLFIVVPRLRGSVARALLTLSSLSIFAGMALAMYYAVGRAFDIETIALHTMLTVHAPINAIGFVLAGLLGWWLENRASNRDKVVLAPKLF